MKTNDNNFKFLIFKQRKKKTTLRNIEKEDIKRYIYKITKLNKDIEIYKIYYNSIKKTLSIIANKRIQIQRILNKNIIFFKSISDLKKEYERISLQNTIVEEEYINLENIKHLFGEIINIIYEQNNNLENNMEFLLKNIYGHNAGIVIYNYDSENNTIKLGFTKDYSNRKYKPITITIKDKKISCIKSDTKESDNILKIVNNELLQLFNNYKRLKIFDSEYIDSIRSVNANFYISATLYGITICSKYNDTLQFKIKYSTYEDKFYINSNDEKVKNYLQEIAPTLLKLIYIPIIECPSWSQDKLYNIRDKELNNNKIKKRYRKQ